MSTLSKIRYGLKIAAWVVVGGPLYLLSWGLDAAHGAVSRALWGPGGGP